MSKQKLEQDKRPKLEPRILLEDPAKSYHAKHRVPATIWWDYQSFGHNDEGNV